MCPHRSSHLDLAVASQTHHVRASAAVELIIMLPVFLLILFAMLYVGELSLYKGRTHFGGQYAMDAAGDQSEQGPVRGTVTDKLYPSPVGELTVAESPPEPADIPEDGELSTVFDEMCEVVYSTVATGRYVLSGGRLRFVVSTYQSQRLSRDGQYVVAHGLRDYPVPELCTDLLQGWEKRNRVDLTYSYHPDYIDIGRWALEPVELSTRFQAAIRADKKREVTDPPRGANHQIDTVTADPRMTNCGQLPHYPSFFGDARFWKPD